MKKIVLLAVVCSFAFACERSIPPSMRTAQDLSDREKPLVKDTPKAPAEKPAAKAPAPPAELVVSDAAMKAAQAKYDLLCVTCHGANGKGDGAVGKALNPKPRDYTDVAWQDSVDNDYLAKAILGGGSAVGKSALMPASPDLKGKPEVVNGLIKIIRSFKGK